MKKITVVILLIVLLVAPVFAVSVSDYGNMNDVGEGDGWGVRGISNAMPNVLSPRVFSIGGTGTALSTGIDSLYMNPANLAKNQAFFFDFPFANAEVMSVSRFMQALRPDTEGGKPSLPKILLALLENANNGNGQIINANVGLGFTVKGFGMNILADVGMYSYSEGATGDAQFFTMMTAGVTLGYGFNVYNQGPHQLAFGLSINFMFRAYTEPYTYTQIVDLFNQTPEGASASVFMDVLFPRSRKTMAGFLHPFTVGMSYTYGDWLTVSVAMRDMWASQTGMKNYDGLLDSFYGMFGGGQPTTGKVNFGFMDMASLDVGIAFNPKWKWFNPRLELDFYNLTNYTEKEKSDFLTLFLSHFRVGAEIQLVEFLALRAGIDAGRVSFGVGLDLFPIVLDVSYGWKEFGTYAGEKAIDYLSVVVKLGWDRTK